MSKSVYLYTVETVEKDPRTFCFTFNEDIEKEPGKVAEKARLIWSRKHDDKTVKLNIHKLKKLID